MTQEGLPLYWETFPEYTIQGGWARPKGLTKQEAKKQRLREGDVGCKDTRSYLPADRPELPGEIAKLNRGNTAAVLKFCSRYGLLGFFQIAEFDANLRNGDPLSWIWAHAETMHLCLTLKDWIDQEAIDDIESRLRAYPQVWKRSGTLSPMITFATRGKVRKMSFSP